LERHGNETPRERRERIRPNPLKEVMRKGKRTQILNPPHLPSLTR
jgi:hypothetical protein